jgi:hypothetical protein
MTKRLLQLTGTASIAFTLFFAHPRCHAQTGTEVRAASVLFKQFEVVAYTKTAFLSSSEPHGVADVDSESHLRLPFLALLGSLRYLGKTTETGIEESYSSVVVGAREFISPQGLGMVNSSTCYIGILRSGAQPNIASYFRQATYESIEGRQVWTWSVPPYEGYPKPTTFYAAQIEDSYFVLSNNLQDFQAVTTSLTASEHATAAFMGVPGWNAFSTQDYWLYRSIRRSGAVDPNAAGTSLLAPDVSAIIFFADAGKRQGTVRVLSSDTTMKTKPNVLPDSELSRLQPQGAGVWQASLPLGADEPSFDTMFHLFYFLGYGVSI